MYLGLELSFIFALDVIPNHIPRQLIKKFYATWQQMRCSASKALPKHFFSWKGGILFGSLELIKTLSSTLRNFISSNFIVRQSTRIVRQCWGKNVGGIRKSKRCLALNVSKNFNHFLNLCFNNVYFAVFLDPASKWYQYESILHLLRGASESVDTEENTFVPEMLKVLPKLPKHPKVMDSLVFFLGSLSEWLNSHPSEIANVIPILLQGLENVETATACSFSLKDICHECAMLMDETLSNEVLQACYKGLANNKTPAKICIRLFEIGGYVVSALPSQQINAQLEVLVSPLFQWFKDIVTKEKSKTNKRLIHYLNCFLGLFRTLDPFEEQVDHPVSIVFGQLIPLFRFLKPWCDTEEVVVAATLCIQKALEISREKLAPHVNITSECLADFFSIHPYGCILDASSTLIGMFGSVPECTERVRNLYLLLTPVCINIIESGEGRNLPDCLQSFMEFLTRVIKTVPEFLITNEEQQKSVIKCALIILNYPEAPTIKSASNFLITYINFSSCFSSAKEMVEYVGRDIIVQSLLCIGGVAPRHTIDHFAEIILALNKNFVSLLASWLGEVITKEGFPTVNASLTQKEHFKKAVLREKASKRRMKEIVKDFSLACRGLQGMAYVR